MPTDSISAGDTTWVIVAAALVMLMTPGLAFFYGGLVREKNVLGTIMHSFVVIALVSLLWVTVGYSLAFGPDHGGIIGGLDWLMLKDVGQTANADYSATIPHLAFMAFQTDVRDNHSGPHHRRLRRAGQVQHLSRLHGSLVAAGLRAGRPLGLGARRLAARTRRPGLRRRHGRARQRRYRRPCRGDHVREAPGVWEGGG